METQLNWFKSFQYDCTQTSTITVDRNEINKRIILFIVVSKQERSYLELVMNSYYFPNIYYLKKVLQSWKNSTLRFWNIYMFWGLLDVFMQFLRLCMYVCMCVCVRMSKLCIRLSSDLECVLQVTIGETLLILVNAGWIFFFTGVEKSILIHYGL